VGKRDQIRQKESEAQRGSLLSGRSFGFAGEAGTFPKGKGLRNFGEKPGGP